MIQVISPLVLTSGPVEFLHYITAFVAKTAVSLTLLTETLNSFLAKGHTTDCLSHPFLCLAVPCDYILISGMQIELKYATSETIL